MQHIKPPFSKTNNELKHEILIQIPQAQCEIKYLSCIHSLNSLKQNFIIRRKYDISPFSKLIGIVSPLNK